MNLSKRQISCSVKCSSKIDSTFLEYLIKISNFSTCPNDLLSMKWCHVFVFPPFMRTIKENLEGNFFPVKMYNKWCRKQKPKEIFSLRGFDTVFTPKHSKDLLGANAAIFFQSVIWMIFDFSGHQVIQTACTESFVTKWSKIWSKLS